MIDQINEDLKQAMRDGDQPKLVVLRSLKTALKNAEVENKGSLDDDAAMAAIKRQSKQRQEAADAFAKAGDQASSDKELAEKDIIDTYLPEQMDEDAIEAVVKDTIAAAGSDANRGQIMGQIMGKLKGQADGSVVARLVGKHLG